MRKAEWREFWSMGFIAMAFTAAMISGIFIGVSLATSAAETAFEKMIIEHQMRVLPQEDTIKECIIEPDVIIEGVPS